MAIFRARRRLGSCELCLVALAAVLLPGCGSQPRAPALRDEPVYQNDQEGFRFRVPEGWTQHARSELPKGPVNKEHLLVRYMAGTAKGGVLEVSLADPPESTDLSKYLSGPSYGSKQWRRASPAQSLEGQGLSATRFVFTATVAEAEMTKEVVAFRRGGRVYFFTGLFSPTDGKTREEVRRAVGSTIWKD